jgi:hypothetical protein
MTNDDDVRDITTLKPAEAAPRSILLKLRFSGDALEKLEYLKTHMSSVIDEYDVISRAIEIVLSAKERELLIRDTAGQLLAVDVWK